ncbi:MAG: hypothetical protein Q8L48_20410 [Archangium sp.]|nr:hypothetical protein [Archangium sp.]
MSEEEVETAESHRLDEFDVGTRIDVMTDGSLRLRFGLMPPSWFHSEGAFESFEEKLSGALGVEVEGLDKELFAISEPKPDTVERAKAWLLELRRSTERKR